MKNTNFERVERTSGGKNREEVVIHSKKRHAHWQLKLISLLLAAILWLIMVNVYEKEHREEGEILSPESQTAENE